MRTILSSPSAGAAALALLSACAPAAAAGPAVPVHAFDDPALEWGPCPDFMPEGCAIAVAHGDPAGAQSDVFFRVPGKSVIPLHWHTQAERMVLVDGRLRALYDGQPAALLQPGTYAYGPPRAPHSAVCESKNPCVLLIAFDGPVDAYAGRPPGK